jgi:hypothetical protein
MLYFALVRSKLECASVGWNSVTVTDSNKLERVQKEFAALRQQSFVLDLEYHHDDILEKLNLQTLHIRRRLFDVLFLINVCNRAKCCPSLHETVGIRVPTRNIRNFTKFSCSSSRVLRLHLSRIHLGSLHQEQHTPISAKP